MSAGIGPCRLLLRPALARCSRKNVSCSHQNHKIYTSPGNIRERHWIPTRKLAATFAFGAITGVAATLSLAQLYWTSGHGQNQPSTLKTVRCANTAEFTPSSSKAKTSETGRWMNPIDVRDIEEPGAYSEDVALRRQQQQHMQQQKTQELKAASDGSSFSYSSYWSYLFGEPTSDSVRNDVGSSSSPLLSQTASSVSRNRRSRYAMGSFIADAVEDVMDSVVNITVETTAPAASAIIPAFRRQPRSLVSSGSGFFIDDHGTILTNAHVVCDAADGEEDDDRASSGASNLSSPASPGAGNNTHTRLTITTSDGRTHKGCVHAIDLMSDLAIVKIIHDEPQDSSKSSIKIEQPLLPRGVRLGSQRELRPGDWVIAIGSPFNLMNTVTAGIVSSRRRRGVEIGVNVSMMQVSSENSTPATPPPTEFPSSTPSPSNPPITAASPSHLSGDALVDFIQSDCVIHSGSSGGPLINLDGEVVGICTTRAESEGISFAIRVDGTSLPIISQLLHSRKVTRPYLGCRLVTLTPKVLEQVRGVSGSGALVAAVAAASPAARAGMVEGDVVVAVDGVRIASAAEVHRLCAGQGGKGRSASVTVSRHVPVDIDWDGRARSFEVVELELRIPLEEIVRP